MENIKYKLSGAFMQKVIREIHQKINDHTSSTLILKARINVVQPVLNVI